MRENDAGYFDNKRDRAVALCDCNNFFVSCERIIDKSLWNVPVIVLSSNDGCVVARSNEAKALGIKMGVPYHQIAGICKARHVRVLSGNLSFYTKVSKAVMNTLREFSDTLENYSIDESFLNMNIRSIEDPVGYCRKIRSVIWDRCRIPVSIGIAANKTLAKLASEFAKKNKNTGGVFWIDRSLRESGFVAATPCSDIWNIGRKTTEALNRFNIQNCGQLLAKDEMWVKQNFGIPGLAVYWELQGRMIHCITEVSKAPKSIQVSRTFSTKISSYDELIDPLLCFTVSAAAQMRKHKLAAQKFAIYISTGRFAEESQKYYNWAEARFPVPKFADSDFIETAQKLLKSIYRDGYKYNKCGVMLHELTDTGHGMQSSLFPEEEGVEVSPKKLAFSKAVDGLNDEYKKSVIKPAVLFKEDRSWTPKSEKRSNSEAYEELYARMAQSNTQQTSRAFKNHALDTIR